MKKKLSHEERRTRALEGIALGLNALAAVQRERLDKEFPPQEAAKDAEVYKVPNPEEGKDSFSGGRFERTYKKARGLPV